VNGIAAGLSTKSNKIGYIAAKPISLVLRNVNSFMLGARKVNPNATVQLIVTGDWTMPVREAEATNALVDAGCDVIACHIDSPKVVIETAEKRGVRSCGHNANQADLAPKGFITGAELKWGTIYKSFAGMIAKGEKLPNMVIGGYDQDMVASSPFGAGVSEAGRNAAMAAIADLKAGKPIFTGTVKTNTGKVITSKDTPLYDPSSKPPIISSRESSVPFDSKATLAATVYCRHRPHHAMRVAAVAGYRRLIIRRLGRGPVSSGRRDVFSIAPNE
jgi:simple sugar transport system substrate-binding protein